MREFKQRLAVLRERHLDEVLALIEETVAEHSPPGSSLVPMCGYHFSTGGKRLRAMLPLLVADALEVDPGRLVPFAAACEMIHNATLVHDDLQDGDRIRRGQETVWAHYGAARAINLGDAMLYFAILLVERLDAPPERRLATVARLARDVIRVVDGQEREFLLKEAKIPTLAEYFTMVEGKTSGLFALPAAGAAELCEADPALVDALSKAATDLGVIFQIQDDVLDLYGDKGRGERGSDIGEGKISALVVHCLQHAPQDQARWLRELLVAGREQVMAADIERASALFIEAGSLDFALAEIGRRKSAATAYPALAAHPRLANLVAQMATLFVEPIEQIYAPE
ncbi:MAG: polyprenyl synthetase family protein [Bradymonadaceae bacterium]|nr:polyprenyl synthetase family protein [Lujinxingiaceae bacterium]